MRLIDADELIITILTHDLCDTEQIDKDILEAPTVKAIPIDFLKQYLYMHSEKWDAAVVYGVKKVIDDWEKENGN